MVCPFFFLKSTLRPAYIGLDRSAHLQRVKSPFNKTHSDSYSFIFDILEHIFSSALINAHITHVTGFTTSMETSCVTWAHILGHGTILCGPFRTHCPWGFLLFTLWYAALCNENKLTLSINIEMSWRNQTDKRDQGLSITSKGLQCREEHGKKLLLEQSMSINSFLQLKYCGEPGRDNLQRMQIPLNDMLRNMGGDSKIHD